MKWFELQMCNLRDVKVCYLIKSEIPCTFWILDAVNRLIVDLDGSSKSIQMEIDDLIEIKISPSPTQQILRECSL